MNRIIERQNTPAMQRLMKARRAAFRVAERWQGLQLLLLVALPAIGAAIGLALPCARPAVAMAALAATLLDVWLIDPMQKDAIKLGAKVSETFDCEVLELPWNEFVAGARLDPELVERHAAAFRGDEAELQGWYSPPAIGLAPLAMGRLICQRENLWYNRDLRRRAVGLLGILAGALVLVVVVLATVLDLTLAEMIVTVAAPASPVLLWALRERLRQREAADSIDQVKTAAETFWNQAVSAEPSDDVAARRSREFQDAIFQRRAGTALPLPGLYRASRPGMEAPMAAGAIERLRQIGIDA